jgi:hypothetical protein
MKLIVSSVIVSSWKIVEKIKINVLMKRQLRGIALEQYKTSLPKFNQTQKNIIVGTLLGDSTLQRGNSGVKPLHTLKFEQKADNNSYLDSIYSKLEDFCGSSPQFYVTKSGIVKSYWFKTYGLRAFDFYANQFYNIDEKTGKRKKVVPKLIHRWLNPESLAYWFMDDGSRHGKSGYILHTQGFTLRENEKLADALGKRFKFEVNIHKDNNKKTGKKGYRLYITVNSRDKFTEIVSPYIVPCFYYKLIR